ncbi:MAG: SPOR domain-containing protein [Planctomycetes bacterium]|nr:SPOR domain-containing protein [Planctomycetota bacterium]
MRTNVIRGTAALAAILAAALLTGCQAPLQSQSSGLAASRSAYAAGQYPQSLQKARTIADLPTSPSRDREQAAYIAGLSAYRLRDLDTAQQYLQVAALSDSPSLSGDARATLGLVFAERGSYGLAADNLLTAAERMTGQNKANAYFYAGVAQQKHGRWPQGRTTLSLAKSASTDPAFRQRVDEQLKITGYTLQLGAFTVESNANTAAQRIAGKAAALHLGAPRVIPAVDPSGHTVYLAQVGQFSSWPTALMARDGLGLTNPIVVPLKSGQ